MAWRDDDDEAADESRVATWLGLRFFGREKGRASLSSFLAPYSTAVPLLSFCVPLLGAACDEDELRRRRGGRSACVRACVAVIVLRGESASLVMFVAPSFSPRNRHRCASDDAPVC